MRVLSTKFVVGPEEAVHIGRLEQSEAKRRQQSLTERKCREVEGKIIKQDKLPPDPRWDQLPEVGL